MVLTVAAVLGNVSGYWIGRLIGPPLFKPRPGLMGKIFKQTYVDKTHVFFEQYGNRALILARFVPIVRTFVTLVAGVGRMDFRKFITYTAIGGVLWACGITILGLLPRHVPFIQNNIEAVLVLIVFVSLIPMLVEYLLHKRRAKQALAAAAAPTQPHRRAVGRTQPTCRSASAARIGGRNCGALSGIGAVEESRFAVGAHVDHHHDHGLALGLDAGDVEGQMRLDQVRLVAVHRERLSAGVGAGDLVVVVEQRHDAVRDHTRALLRSVEPVAGQQPGDQRPSDPGRLAVRGPLDEGLLALDVVAERRTVVRNRRVERRR